MVSYYGSAAWDARVMEARARREAAIAGHIVESDGPAPTRAPPRYRDPLEAARRKRVARLAAKAGEAATTPAIPTRPSFALAAIVARSKGHTPPRAIALQTMVPETQDIAGQSDDGRLGRSHVRAVAPGGAEVRGRIAPAIRAWSAQMAVVGLGMAVSAGTIAISALAADWTPAVGIAAVAGPDLTGYDLIVVGPPGTSVLPDALEPLGLDAATLRTTRFAVSQTTVSYYHLADAPAADILAAELGGAVLDLTGLHPRPPVGRLEAHLADG